MNEGKSEKSVNTTDLAKLGEAVKSVTGANVSPIIDQFTREHTRAAKMMNALKIPASVQLAIDAMEKAVKIPDLSNIQNNISNLQNLVPPNPIDPGIPSGRVNAMFEHQRKLIDELTSNAQMIRPGDLKALEYIKPPHNPTYDTNEKIDRLVTITQNGVIINNELQSNFKDFLTDFKNAASSSNKSAHRTTVLAILAIFISIFTFLYTEFWRGPEQDEKISQQISIMIRQIENNSRAQILSSEKMATSVDNSNQENAELLRQIAKLLEAQADKQNTPPKPAE